MFLQVLPKMEGKMQKEYIVKIGGATKVCSSYEEAEELKAHMEKYRFQRDFNYPETAIKVIFQENNRLDIVNVEKNFDQNFSYILTTLPEREAQILDKRLRMGYTLKAIALQENRTVERIRQLEQRALKRLQVPSRLVILRLGIKAKELQDDIVKIEQQLTEKKEELSKQLNVATKIDVNADFNSLPREIQKIIEFIINREIKENPIEKLELSTRTYNCLRRARIRTIEDLKTKTNADLLRIRYMGKKSVKEIREKLAKHV
jgi:RNA polymerase sigma factor (sigma-70 family)